MRPSVHDRSGPSSIRPTASAWISTIWRPLGALGVAGLHVSAWQHWEPDRDKDAWLRRLIEACHRRASWFTPGSSSPRQRKFWADHPECREQTALLQDAHLDWRS